MGMAQETKLKIKSRKSKVIEKIIFFVLLGLIIYNVASVVWEYKDKYLASNYWQNFPALEKIYLNSQYISKNPPGWTPDEVVFSYAGGKLIQGTNPVLIIPDAPPLGKYLIGLSTIIFDNDSIVILLSAILSLALLYLLSCQIFSNKILALLPAFFLSFEPIFKNQLKYAPLMDLFQLVFILACFYLFNKGLVSKRILAYFSLANLFLGFFIATKFFISGFVIIASLLLVLLYNKDKKRIIRLILTLPISLFVLLASYSRVFAFGYAFNKFLGIQKWVYLYHQSFLIFPFSVWPLLLLNKWYVWFGDKPVISDGQWSVTWPILTIMSIITIIFYVFKKIQKNKNLEIPMAWLVAYMSFLSIGQVFSRYFVILVPFLYIISLYGLVSLYKYVKK
jgi:hypothetical protein